MTGVIKEIFQDPLVSLIGYLRLQVIPHAEMGTTCPTWSTTRLLSLRNCSSWILNYRELLDKYLEETIPIVTPEKLWWVLLACVSTVMASVVTCFKSIQEQDTHITEQNILMRRLVDELKELLNITVVTGFDTILDANVGEVAAQ